MSKFAIYASIAAILISGAAIKINIDTGRSMDRVRNQILEHALETWDPRIMPLEGDIPVDWGYWHVRVSDSLTIQIPETIYRDDPAAAQKMYKYFVLETGQLDPEEFTLSYFGDLLCEQGINPHYAMGE